MRALGIDPGLRYTALVFVESRGPVQPKLLSRVTIHLPGLDPYEMALHTRTWLKALLVNGDRPDVVGLEDFEHRPYLQTLDGSPRRIPHAANMGMLVGDVRASVRHLGLRARIIPAGTSKAGYPSSQTQLRTLLPRELRNGHERSAFLVASAALSLVRTDGVVEPDPDVIPLRRHS